VVVACLLSEFPNMEGMDTDKILQNMIFNIDIR